jgi:hypothetical protein
MIIQICICEGCIARGISDAYCLAGTARCGGGFEVPKAFGTRMSGNAAFAKRLIVGKMRAFLPFIETAPRFC